MPFPKTEPRMRGGDRVVADAEAEEHAHNLTSARCGDAEAALGELSAGCAVPQAEMKRRRPVIQTERDIQRRVVDLLRAAGAEVIENRSQKWDALAGAIAGNRAGKGTVDLVVAVPGGVTWWIECKRPGGKKTLEQEAHHARLRSLGHVVLVVEDHLELVAYAIARQERLWPEATRKFAERLLG
jgi:hypothetical protein